jgi:hypothetical protein
MPFFEILMIMERFNEDIEKESERQKSQQNDTQAQIESVRKHMPNPNQYRHQSYQMPKIQMPKL